MNRSRLKRVTYNAKHLKDIAEYKKQRNIVVPLKKEGTQTYYANLDPNEVGKNKMFWRTFKPLLSNNCHMGQMT